MIDLTTGQYDQAFVRQRRNLMSISIVLLFYEFTGLRMNVLNVFGTTIQLEHPQRVTSILWFAAVYWLVRFYQHSNIGPLLGSARQGAYAYCKPAILKVLRRDEPSLFAVDDSRIVGRPKIIISDLTLVEQGGGLFGFFDYDVEVEKRITVMDSGVGSKKSKHRVSIRGVILYFMVFRAFIVTSIRTPLFTDLVLPYIFFCFPIFYLCFKSF